MKMNEKAKPTRKQEPHIKNHFKRSRLKTKKRKTTVVIESAM